ncbi:photosystem I reaction center subunit III, chloroplastic [Punica granatum]|uniref:Photosystem I reaction center subunit III n=2 Tax=Punica granatum TaxID=22663 RepID=A0A218X0R0_PUNGR|nr:photosystem I reaction center subunit III, chloroplastic [Punica granatum]OWM78309.1 hypothetical protein CDL15_Pgr001030 [Punica granatum]
MDIIPGKSSPTQWELSTSASPLPPALSQNQNPIFSSLATNLAFVPRNLKTIPLGSRTFLPQNLNLPHPTEVRSNMSLTIPTNLSKPILSKPRLGLGLGPGSRPQTRPRSLITCSVSEQKQPSAQPEKALQAFSAALALSSVLLSAAPEPAAADIAGLTPCKESKQFAKREKQQLKKLESSLKLYAPDSAPALAIKATMEKTKRRFDNYGKQGLLCGTDGLPHLIVSGDQRHWGEFITPGILFLYIAGWIGWVGRSYLIAIRDDKKPTMKEIIIDVPLASRLMFRGFIWPVAAYREFVNGDLIVKDV